MALSVEEFERAIEDLERAWREVVDDDHREGDGDGDGMWQDVRVCESFAAKYLRITRGLPDLSPASRSNGERNLFPIDNDHAPEEEEQEVEETDPEALPLPIPIPQNPPKLAAAVLYTIHHSPTYQVPILYLTFLDPLKNKPLPLPSPSEIYTLLVPSEMKAPLRHVGVMGALSMAEHPVSGAPAYFVHPCRTREVLGALVADGGEGDRGGDDDRSELQYLMRWFGVIGASVGLSVPVGVAVRVSGMS